MKTNNIIITEDGFVWHNVTDKAKEIFGSGIFELFEVWKDENGNYVESKIEDKDHLLLAREQSEICISVGHLPIEIKCETIKGWDRAHKIKGEDGYMYIRTADLIFTKEKQN